MFIAVFLSRAVLLMITFPLLDPLQFRFVFECNFQWLECSTGIAMSWKMEGELWIYHGKSIQALILELRSGFQ